MAKCYGLFWQQWFCSEKPPASQRQCQCIEVILCIELKQSCCENLESVLSVFAKLSWNYLPSLGGCRLVTCSVLAGIRQYITSLSIYFRDMPSFDGLYLKKGLQQTLAALWDKILMFHVGPMEHCLGCVHATWWSFLCSTMSPHRALISFIWCSTT